MAGRIVLKFAGKPGAAGMFALLLASPAAAHHSFAMFDAQKNLTLQGTVKNFEWTNPHMWLYVMVPQADGTPVEYPLEMMAVQGAVRLGFRRELEAEAGRINGRFAEVDWMPLRYLNRGFARAVNEGCRLSQGEWLLLLNPDMELAPTFLDGVLALAEQLSAAEPHAGIVGFALQNRDGSRQHSAGEPQVMV